MKTNLYEADSYLANARDKIATKHNRKILTWFTLNLIVMITFCIFMAMHVKNNDIPGWLGFLLFVVGVYQAVLTAELALKLQVKRRKSKSTLIRNKPSQTEVKLKHWLPN